MQYSLQLSSQFDLDIDTCDGLIVMGAKNTDHRKLAKLDKPLVLFGENPYFDFADTDNQKTSIKLLFTLPIVAMNISITSV